jgi:hypothetical protein
MDSSSNSLDKFLPKSIAAKRRRNKASSTAGIPSTSNDVAPQKAPGSSGSDANSLHSSLKSTNTDPAVSDSHSEP